MRWSRELVFLGRLCYGRGASPQMGFSLGFSVSECMCSGLGRGCPGRGRGSPIKRFPEAVEREQYSDGKPGVSREVIQECSEALGRRLSW